MKILNFDFPLSAPGRILAAVIVCLALGASSARGELSVVDGGIRFTYVDPAAGSVSWVGDFNGWNGTANPMTKDGDTWSVVMPLPAGEHMYKFLVNGSNWIADPDNPVTKGEYGNSVITIDADGQLRSAAATSNTALNPKILIGGRFVSLFIASKDMSENDRLELARPDFDLDLDFKIRMSDVLDAHMLTNVESQTEDVQFFRSRLNFDRGSLHLHSDRIDLFAFDNDRLATWDDPLHIVGDIGIYHHDFGYVQQGMQAKRTFAGTDVQVLYSDNFRPGGTSRPGLTEDLPSITAQIVRGQKLIADYRFSDTDNDKDILAGRATRGFGKDLKVGLSGRLDRGQNPGAAGVAELSGHDSTGAPTSLLFASGPALERWWAFGGDVEYTRGKGTLRAEYLHGKNELDFVPGSTAERVPAPFNEEDAVALDHVPSFPIATDNRAFLGWEGKARGLDLGLSWRFHGTDITPIGNDSAQYLDNSLRTWNLAAGRGFRLSNNRTASARLALEIDDFSYDPRTPWKNQFWFDSRNFWLEAGEHTVSFDRMVMVGGNDVISWKPSFSVDLLPDGELRFRYAGTFNAVSFDTRPKFIESLFQATYKLSAQTTLYSDTRWAKYDDPVLGLTDGYLSTFLEASYAFTPGITFALSWGVDPYVIDVRTNEYDYIGRDAFLFGKDATGARAQDNYYSLADIIPAAEKALHDERRIQLEAIVRF